MNKWIPRLTGVLVIIVLAIFVATTWFRPEIPDSLQRDINLQVQGQEGQGQGALRPVPAEETEPVPFEAPPAGNAPTLTLTSLEDIPEEGSAPPVLTNPQPADTQAVPATALPPPAGVQTPAPQPVAPPVAQPPQTVQGDSFIAAGAFGNPDNTERRVAQLRSRGWPVKVEKIQSGGKTLDRVMLGPIPANQINRYLDELNKMGVQGRQIQ